MMLTLRHFVDFFHWSSAMLTGECDQGLQMISNRRYERDNLSHTLSTEKMPTFTEGGLGQRVRLFLDSFPNETCGKSTCAHAHLHLVKSLILPHFLDLSVV